MDRIDLHVEVHELPHALLLQTPTQTETSNELRDKIIRARQLQFARQGMLNKHLQGKLLDEYCRLDDTLKSWLQDTLNQLQLSARAYHRTLKVARSIADLDQSTHIESLHLTEALGFRELKIY